MRRDIALACLLAFGMSLIWFLRDRANLIALRLPDTDDIVRLQQIRDWLSGQRFGDLTQYRLGGPAGLAMHWSRLGDLMPAGVIRVLTPLAGRHAAEILAVTIWPATTFAAALLLIGRIARRLGLDGAATTMIVAALAFPTTTLFAPGRIDHHGLQIVLLLASVLAALGGPTIRNGASIGLLAATSLVVGMETTPLLATIGAAMIARWIAGDDASGGAIAALGGGALIGLAVAYLVFAGTGWHYPACDGFTREAAAAVAALACAPIVLAGLGRGVAHPLARAVCAVGIGAGACLAVLTISPGCRSPYGQVDPLIVQLWLSQVGEAQSLFAASPQTALGYVGLIVAGLIATAMRLRRTRSAGWALMLALQGASLILASVQLRGAYGGAILAAPALAAMIDQARRRGAVRLIGAWLVSAGILYPLAAAAALRRTEPAAPAMAACSPRLLANALSGLSAGMVFAPIDVGAWGLTVTPHHFAAAPYHRDNVGNLAMYRFFLGSPTVARDIARRWRVDYVATCRGDFVARTERGVTVAGLLATGRPPAWLKALPTSSPDIVLLRVEQSRRPLSRKAS